MRNRSVAATPYAFVVTSTVSKSSEIGIFSQKFVKVSEIGIFLQKIIESFRNGNFFENEVMFLSSE